jgi:hypothetical protein
MTNCNKITKISSLLTNKLMSEMDTISSSLVTKLDFNTSLTLMKNLHFNNMTNTALFNNLELNLLSKLKTSIIFPNQLIDCLNFSNIISLNTRLLNEIMIQAYYKSPLLKSKDISCIEDTIKHNKFSNIKREVLRHQQNKDTFFPNERINSKIEANSVLMNSLQLDSKYINDCNITFNKENAIIEIIMNGRKIIFAEICDVSSNGFKQFQNMFNIYKPKVVLINNEPIYNKNNNTFLSKLSNKNDLYDCLKDKKYRVRNLSNEVFKDNSFSICESVALYSLINNSLVEFFDIPVLDYLKTFALNNNEEFNNLKPLLKVINMTNILFWIGYNIKEGCFECNKSNNIRMEPLSLEFLVSRDILPNYKSINSYRINRIISAINNTNHADNIVVYSNNIHLDLKLLIEYNNEIVDEEEIIINNVDIIKNMAYGVQFKTNTLDYLSTETYSVLNDSSTSDFKTTKVANGLINKFDMYLKQEFAYLYGIDTDLRLLIRKLSRENNKKCLTEGYYNILTKMTNTLI